MSDFVIEDLGAKKRHLRMALTGMPKAGKTWTAAKVMAGLLDPDEPYVIIDTEAGSSTFLAGVEGGVGNAKVLSLNPPFSPKRFVDAMRVCAKTGFKGIIIDSLSHAWSGSGGTLEMADKGGATGWAKVTPILNSLLDAIQRYPGHVIVTCRAKVLTTEETDERGRKRRVDIGLGMEQKKGFEYEIDISAELERPGKDVILTMRQSRYTTLDGQQFVNPGSEIGQMIRSEMEGRGFDRAADAQLVRNTYKLDARENYREVPMDDPDPAPPPAVRAQETAAKSAPAKQGGLEPGRKAFGDLLRKHVGKPGCGLAVVIPVLAFTGFEMPPEADRLDSDDPSTVKAFFAAVGDEDCQEWTNFLADAMGSPDWPKLVKDATGLDIDSTKDEGGNDPSAESESAEATDRANAAPA